MKLGIGFLFGAKDDGILKMIKSVRQGILGLTEEIEAVGPTAERVNKKRPMQELARDTEKADSWMSTLFNSMTQIQLVDIRSKLGDVGDLSSGLERAVSGGMSTKIEGMFTEFDRGFKAAAARTGFLGNDLKKLESQVFSTAYAMNRGAEEVGNNVLALERAGLTFEQILGKGATMTDFQKVVEATGLSAADYASSFQGLSKGWDMGEAGARDFFDAFSKQATALGIGQEAFESFPGMLKTMNKEWAVTLQAMGPDAVKSALLGTAKLGALLQEVTGDDAKSSMESAQSMFAAIAQSGTGFKDLMIGMGGELTPFTEQLAFLGVGTGGIKGALDALAEGAKDPAKFMGTLGTIFAQLDEKGGDAATTMKTRLLTSLATIDPAMSFLVQKGDKVAEVFAAMDVKSANAGVGMKELGKQAHASGLTLDDVLTRAKDGLENAFGQAFKPERLKIVKVITDAYKFLGRAIRGLTGDSKKSDKSWRKTLGTFGISVKWADRIKSAFKALRATLNGWFDKAGPLSGLVVGLGVVSSMFGTLVLAMTPLIAVALPMLAAGLWPISIALGALAGATLQLGPPMLLLAATWGIVALALRGELGDAIQYVSQRLQDAFVYVAKFGTKMLTTLTGWLKKINGADIIKGVKHFVKTVYNGIVSAFSTEIKVNPETKNVGTEFLEALLGAWGEVKRIAGEFVEYVWNSIVAWWDRLDISKMITDWTNSVDWDGIGTGILTSIATSMTDLFSYIGDLGDSAATWLEGVDWIKIGQDISAYITGAIGSGLDSKSAIWVLKDKIVGMFMSSLTAMSTPAFWKSVGDMLWAGAKIAFEVFRGIGGLIFGLIGGSAKGMTDMFFGAGAFDATIAKLLMGITIVKTAFASLWADIKAGAQALFGNSINTFVSHDFGVIEAIIETAKGWFTVLGEVAKNMFAGILGALTLFLKPLAWVGDIIGSLADKFGFKAPDVQAVIEAEKSGGSTSSVKSLVQQAGDSLLVNTIIEQHTQDRYILNKILERTGSSAVPAGQSKRVSSADPSSTLAKS